MELKKEAVHYIAGFLVQEYKNFAAIVPVVHDQTPIHPQGRNGQFSVTNNKTLIMIGDRAQLQFQLSLSIIGYVGVYNLAFQSPRIDVSSVDYFVMKNCNLYVKLNLGMHVFYSMHHIILRR